MLVLHYGVILFWNDGGMVLNAGLKSQQGKVIKMHPNNKSADEALLLIRWNLTLLNGRVFSLQPADSLANRTAALDHQ